MERHDFLIHKLNYEPVIYKGCSAREIFWVAMVFMVPLCPLSAFIGGWVWGNPFFGLAAGLLVGVMMTLKGVAVVGKLKRDKEMGYFSEVAHDMLEKIGIGRGKLIRYTGYWSVGGK